jgi:hypothetical protein
MHYEVLGQLQYLLSFASTSSYSFFTLRIIIITSKQEINLSLIGHHPKKQVRANRHIKSMAPVPILMIYVSENIQYAVKFKNFDDSSAKSNFMPPITTRGRGFADVFTLGKEAFALSKDFAEYSTRQSPLSKYSHDKGTLSNAYPDTRQNKKKITEWFGRHSVIKIFLAVTTPAINDYFVEC